MLLILCFKYILFCFRLFASPNRGPKVSTNWPKNHEYELTKIRTNWPKWVRIDQTVSTKWPNEHELTKSMSTKWPKWERVDLSTSWLEYELTGNLPLASFGHSFHLCMVKPHCSNFRTSNLFKCANFRIFMLRAVAAQCNLPELQIHFTN